MKKINSRFPSHFESKVLALNAQKAILRGRLFILTPFFSFNGPPLLNWCDSAR